ncbi:NAD(P)-binding protein [Calocera cornea HHB12733]|uniref:NAD(P)-binding protein n=1 Tax=Calocera cornea HHB12733 TaxID=1353952 RepID=A0A165FPR8_9BASI|nr:NAD(P)-binding protein [Calocera cornea HHB12733]
MAEKLIVVTGATGNQGGAVVRALLASGRYRVRGLSRQPTSASAKQLVEQGVEVLQATLEDGASLVKAFEGAYAVYGCTPFGHPTEEQQGKNIVDACKANQVPLLIWSSLPSATETSGGKYTHVTHFDRKAAVTKYIDHVQQPGLTIYTGMFTDNVVGYGWFGLANDGTYEITIPLSSEVATPYTWVEGDLGGAIVTIIDNWEEQGVRAELQKAQPVHVCSYRISGSEMAASVARVIGKPVRFVGSRSTGSGDLAEVNDGLLYPQVDIPPPILTKLGVKFHTFEDYVRSRIAPSIQ